MQSTQKTTTLTRRAPAWQGRNGCQTTSLAVCMACSALDRIQSISEKKVTRRLTRRSRSTDILPQVQRAGVDQLEAQPAPAVPIGCLRTSLGAPLVQAACEIILTTSKRKATRRPIPRSKNTVWGQDGCRMHCPSANSDLLAPGKIQSTFKR
jgi:hypothetical protein